MYIAKRIGTAPQLTSCPNHRLLYFHLHKWWPQLFCTL